MHDDSANVLARLERFTNEWLTPALYRDAIALAVTVWEVPDEPVPFSDARSAHFEEFAIGTAYGKPWGTTWFHLQGAVPAGWWREGVRPEIVVDLGFSSTTPGFQCEGSVYTPDGVVIKAIENRNRYVPLPDDARTVDVFVEAAANPDVQHDGFTTPNGLGSKLTAGSDPIYVLRSADVRLLDIAVWELLADLRTLSELERELPDRLPRRARIIRAIEDALDALDPADIAGTAGAARQRLRGVLASPACASAHEISAIGHAHIDSAWLWPTRETVRKVARTFSNVLHLMDLDPEFRFAASSAQQYAWIKEYYPELFARVRERVAEGRFTPTGGMWVESDSNMVGGEALLRQFVEGKAFFAEEFDVEPTEVWLPDSFGFSGAFPQIAHAVGAPRLLTQKMSWNDTDRMPHHTFLWRGIDGSAIFTHFPPVDSYNSTLSGEELARAERQFSESGRANRSLVPFGFGDGGGGPTREMLAAGHRAADLEGSPKVGFATPAEFFAAAEEEYSAPPVWDGELYLEFHRGVLTSQHRTKSGNRRSEHLLHTAELWAATATVRSGAPYPAEALERLWRLVLLQQFHDILPGTSIAWVHREAERNYLEIERELTSIIRESLTVLAGDGERELVANASPFAIDAVDAGGIGPRIPRHDRAAVTVVDGGYVLEDDVLRVTLDDRGLIVSLFDKRHRRELSAPGRPLNVLTVYRDIPNQWDAWDIDAHYKRNGVVLDTVAEFEVIPDSGEGPAVRVTRRHGASTFVQTARLRAGAGALDLETDVDWQERRSLLKLGFPVSVHADTAASEIQFGHIRRPIHTNTSWDAARFETMAHRWVHVGEPGYGVAIANDSMYGHDIVRDTSDDGLVTTVSQSLLRAPMMPDPDADQGRHVLHSSLVVGVGVEGAIEEGYRMNLPPLALRGAEVVAPLAVIEGDDHGAVIETVKLARDGSGDVVIRLYESWGARASVRVVIDGGIAEVRRTDALERPTSEAPTTGGEIDLDLRPFEIVTLRARRG